MINGVKLLVLELSVLVSSTMVDDLKPLGIGSIVLAAAASIVGFGSTGGRHRS